MTKHETVCTSKFIMKTKFKIFSLVLLTTLLCACVSRTQYQAYDNQTGGYLDGQFDDGTRWAKFAANAHTTKTDAENFSLFRSIEVCKFKGFKFTSILGTRDLSTTQNVQKTAVNTYQQPTYFSGSGNSNSNVNYLGNGFANVNTQSNFEGSVTGGDQYTTQSSWTEAYTFPLFETGFVCVDSFFKLGFELKFINENDMKPYVKDLKGALQVEKVLDESPNIGKIKVADIIFKVDGERIWNIFDLAKIISKAGDMEKIKLEIIRDGKKAVVYAKAVDKSNRLMHDEEMIKSLVCNAEELKSNYLCGSK